MYYIYPEMESYEGSRDRSIEFASFYRILRRFGAFCVVLVSPFASLPIQGHFGSCPVQIFRQSNLNSKLNFCQIPVVISKLSIYIYIYIYTYIHIYTCLLTVKSTLSSSIINTYALC